MQKIYLVLVLLCCTLTNTLAQTYDSTIVQTIAGTNISFIMKFIPGGNTLIGSPETQEKRSDDEGPQIEVNLKPFYMMETELTWGK